ncbi:FUSC family protein [Cellulomonas fimi]|uniref:FUSC family protein n=1 Tax=Cellulomonas fimi TaxID=1708 RepID=UPI002892AADF|nr:FUSC family protein [Cellulomonas fimi]
METRPPVPLSHHVPRPQDLVAFAPHNESHWIALRAALSVGIPLAVLGLTDHMEWSLFAAFGAFTALFGRTDGYRRRLHTQLAAAAIQVGGVVVGTAVSAAGSGPWGLVLASALVAAIASLVGDGVGWHPVGPLFAVFAVATTAGVPATSTDLVPALGVSAGAAALSVVIGVAGALSPRRRRLPRRPLTAVGPGLPVVRVRGSTIRTGRYAFAVVLAGGVATAAGIGHPSWAMVAAVVPLAAADIPQGSVRAVQRVVGTGLGLVVAAALLLIPDPPVSGWGLIAVVVVLQSLAELFVGRNYGFAMVFITPLALTMSTMVTPLDPGSLLRDRGVETVIGAVIGLALTILSREHRGTAARPSAQPSAG